jgi:hypothetical protein
VTRRDALGSVASLALGAAFLLVWSACEESASNMPPMLLNGGSIVDLDASDASVLGPDGGTLTVLAAGVATPTSMALDPIYVFWTDNVGGVWCVPRAGGTVTLLTTGQASPVGLVFEGNGYWLSGAQSGSLVLFNLSTWTPSTLVSNLSFPFSVAAAPANVFFTAQDTSGTAVTLDEVPIDGGPPHQLAMATGAVSGGGLAIDAETAYFAVSSATGGGAVGSVPLAGGPPVTLWTTGSGQPLDVTLAPGGIYWLVTAGAAQGGLWSIASGGAPTQLLTGLDALGHLAVDSYNAYFTIPGDGQLLSLPLAGGTPAVLASDLLTPYALVVDDAIYFSTVDSILKLSK